MACQYYCTLDFAALNKIQAQTHNKEKPFLIVYTLYTYIHTFLLTIEQEKNFVILIQTLILQKKNNNTHHNIYAKLSNHQ
jgi:hypothetical protein